MRKSLTPASKDFTSLVLLLILLTLGGAIVSSFRLAQVARGLALRSFNVLGSVKDLNISLLDAEAAQRGYLLTKADDYMAAYQTALTRVKGAQSRLGEAAEGDIPLQGQIAAMQPVLDRRVEVLNEIVNVRTRLGFPAALLLVRTHAGQDLMAVVDADLAGMISSEQNVLASRLAADSAQASNLGCLVLLVTSFLAALLLWAMRSMNKAATIDARTGLLSQNRIWALSRPRRRSPRAPKTSMLIVNVDRFRLVNQRFGRQTGDSLLTEVGQRLKQLAGNHALGRLDGDHFALWCRGITVDSAARLGAAIADKMAQPFETGRGNLHLTASVGVAHTEGANGISLRQAADDAMHAAKQRGGNQAVIFVPSMHDEEKRKSLYEEELRLALAREDQLSIAYQPVVRLADRALIAVESLVRWTHPKLGAIGPDAFIQIAEARGLIVPLGLKTMQMAVRQAVDWQRRFPGGCPTININFSPMQFATGNVIDEFAAMLAQHKLAASGFCIEVTEGVFSDATAVAALQNASELGFKVSMDDFGVGYSSLSQLPLLPLTSVKLDRSFISQAELGVRSAATVAAIVQLSHALHLKVVAEGVETAEQLAMVASHGCDCVQGYYFSRPVSPEALELWLTAQRQIPALA